LFDRKKKKDFTNPEIFRRKNGTWQQPPHGFGHIVKKNVRTEKKGFVTATKLGTTINFFVAATKNFAAATKRFVDRRKHFVAATKYFCYPYFNK